jgi:hypothetical protein
MYVGELVYLDTPRGLIPAKIRDTGNGPEDLALTVTAARPGYIRGEWVTANARAGDVVPRGYVHVRSGQYRITNPPDDWYIDWSRETGPVAENMRRVER